MRAVISGKEPEVEYFMGVNDALAIAGAFLSLWVTADDLSEGSLRGTGKVSFNKTDRRMGYVTVERKLQDRSWEPIG